MIKRLLVKIKEFRLMRHLRKEQLIANQSKQKQGGEHGK